MSVNFNQSDARVKINSFYNGANRVFYVRFYETALEEEFLKIAEALTARVPELKVEEMFRTYRVREASNEQSSAWEILMHKYWMLSTQIRKDSVTGEKYYPIRLSNCYIKPYLKRLVAVV